MAGRDGVRSFLRPLSDVRSWGDEVPGSIGGESSAKDPAPYCLFSLREVPLSHPHLARDPDPGT